MNKRFEKAWKFASEDIWDIELTSLTKLKRWGVKSLRVVNLVLRGFRKDECPLHASALTFNTLMAIVPILALSLSLARVFDGAELAEAQLREVVGQLTQRLETKATVSTNNVSEIEADNSVVRKEHSREDGVWTPDEIAQELNNALDAGFRQIEKMNFAALGSLGLVLLLWTVIAVLERVEASFNAVWGVAKGRTLFRKITDYFFMVIILPFLITLAASFSVAEFAADFLKDPWASYVKALIDTGLFKSLTTLALTTFTFTVLIIFMPNTRVRWSAAIAGGLVSALLFIFWLWFCARLQIGVAKYGKLYGSFALVPIILFWVFVSWEIVLFGAEAAFAVQNCTTYRMEYGAHNANMQSRITLGLSVIAEAGRAMLGKTGYFDVPEYARQHRVPVRFLNDIMQEMVGLGFIALIAGKEDCYVLLRPPGEIRILSIVDGMMSSGIQPGSLGLTDADSRIKQIVKTLSTGMGGSLSEMTIKDIV